MQEIKKIVIIGPESTGKTTLCQLLAAHYHTHCCKEYAREYLLNCGTNYTYDDLLTIARGQLLLQEEAEQHIRNNESSMGNGKRNHPLSSLVQADAPLNINSSVYTIASAEVITHRSPLLFIDTDMYVMKVWCEYVFGKCHPFIVDEIVKRPYDLYLLCKPDIAWVKDELREYPDEQIRIELYHIYRDILINQSVPWTEISGDYGERVQMSIEAVEHLKST